MMGTLPGCRFGKLIMNMESSDIRWKQRFQNFEKSMAHLEEPLRINNPDVTQKAGLIKFFEMSFELAWNTMKDFMEGEGFVDIKSPRGAIKKAFETGLVTDGHRWLKLLE